MNTVTPFLTVLEQAKQRLEDAPDAARLEAHFRHDDGVLHGFYLAGAVSQVEARAAHGDLRLIYESRKGLFELQSEWKRRHGDAP